MVGMGRLIRQTGRSIQRMETKDFHHKAFPPQPRSARADHAKPGLRHARLAFLYQFQYVLPMKPVRFLGDSLKRLFTLPSLPKPVLHAFPEKTQATSSQDIAIAKERPAQLMKDRP